MKKLTQLKLLNIKKEMKILESMCQFSRENFEKVYKRLGIQLKEVSESYYDSLSRKIIARRKNIIRKNKGEIIMRFEGENQPLIYDTTEFVALEYRINEWKRDSIIYVFISEQKNHFRFIKKDEW